MTRPWLLVTLSLIAAGSARADCVAEGVALARSDLDAARAALEAAARRRECQEDPLLHYNLGFVRHELARRDDSPRLACGAAEAFRRFLDLDRGGDALAMTQERLRDADARCRPDPAPAPPEPVLEPIVDTRPRDASGGAPWRWATLGLTVAATATAAVSGGLALSEASRARDATTRAQHADHADSADTLSGVSDVAWVVAGIGAAATVAVWVWGPDAPVSLGVSPGGAAFSASF